MNKVAKILRRLAKSLPALAVFLVGFGLSRDHWSELTTPVLIVVGIIAAAMFSKSGGFNLLASREQLTDEDAVKAEISRKNSIQDYLSLGVRLSILTGIMVTIRPILFGGESASNFLSNVLAQIYPITINYFNILIQIMENIYGGITAIIFSFTLRQAWMIVAIEKNEQKVIHNRILEEVNGLQAERRRKEELEHLSTSPPPKGPEGFGETIEDFPKNS